MNVLQNCILQNCRLQAQNKLSIRTKPCASGWLICSAMKALWYIARSHISRSCDTRHLIICPNDSWNLLPGTVQGQVASVKLSFSSSEKCTAPLDTTNYIQTTTMYFEFFYQDLKLALAEDKVFTRAGDRSPPWLLAVSSYFHREPNVCSYDAKLHLWKLNSLDLEINSSRISAHCAFYKTVKGRESKRKKSSRYLCMWSRFGKFMSTCKDTSLLGDSHKVKANGQTRFCWWLLTDGTLNILN